MDSQSYSYYGSNPSCDTSSVGSDGFSNSSGYNSYQNIASHDSCASSTNTGKTTVSSFSVTDLTDHFNWCSMVDRAYYQVQEDIQKGIKADYFKCKCKVCKWFKNLSVSEVPRSRGRPEDEKEYEGQNIWRNNWIYRQKKAMEEETKKAKQTEIFKMNESLNDEYFNLCLEYISLWDNLCPHNRSTLEIIKQNTDLMDYGICDCSQNCQNRRF